MFDSIANVPSFCTFCDAEALKVMVFIVDEDGDPTRFCYTCFQAFQLGQNNPEVEIINAEDEEIRLTCPVCGDTYDQSLNEYEGGNKIYCIGCSGRQIEMLDRRGIGDLKRGNAAKAGQDSGTAFAAFAPGEEARI